MDHPYTQGIEDRDARIQIWTETLQREIAELRRRKRWRIARWILIPSVLLFLWLVLDIRIPFWWYWIFFGANAAVDATADARRELVTSLADSGDPRVVSVLAVAARDGDEVTRKVASKGLRKVLPALVASDEKHITAEGMSALVSLLRTGGVKLTLSILDAFKQVGSEMALTAVRQLAAGSDSVLASTPRRKQQWQILKEAARETLPFVEERVRLQAARDTLLRPTSAGDSTESLLRPAANTQSEGELLLRAATESAES